MVAETGPATRAPPPDLYEDAFGREAKFLSPKDIGYISSIGAESGVCYRKDVVYSSRDREGVANDEDDGRRRDETVASESCGDAGPGIDSGLVRGKRLGHEPA